MAAFLFERTRRLAAWTAILFLIAAFPVYAVLNRVPFGGSELGPAYLWIRGPAQVAFIAQATRRCSPSPTPACRASAPTLDSAPSRVGLVR